MSKDDFSKRLDRERQQRLDKEFLKTKPKGLSKGEYLYRGSTGKWKGGRYRKQAEAQENKEHKAYRKDNPNVGKGGSPIEGTREEYVRRNQVSLKMKGMGSKTSKSKSSRKSKRSSTKRYGK